MMDQTIAAADATATAIQIARRRVGFLSRRRLSQMKLDVAKTTIITMKMNAGESILIAPG
jgi:hypothetical protein